MKMYMHIRIEVQKPKCWNIWVL